MESWNESTTRYCIERQRPNERNHRTDAKNGNTERTNKQDHHRNESEKINCGTNWTNKTTERASERRNHKEKNARVIVNRLPHSL